MIRRLKLTKNELFSNFAINLNLRRYIPFHRNVTNLAKACAVAAAACALAFAMPAVAALVSGMAPQLGRAAQVDPWSTQG